MSLNYYTLITSRCLEHLFLAQIFDESDPENDSTENNSKEENQPESGSQPSVNAQDLMPTEQLVQENLSAMTQREITGSLSATSSENDTNENNSDVEPHTTTMKKKYQQKNIQDYMAQPKL